MFGYQRELKKYEEVDEEELLSTLSSEEIAELERELADLDPDTNVPIGLRQKDQTAKTPVGAFNREALLKYWEEENTKLLEVERVESDAVQKEHPDKSVRGEPEATSANNSTAKNADNDRKRVLQKSKKVPNGLVKNTCPKDDVVKKSAKETPIKTKAAQVKSQSKSEQSETETTEQSTDRPSGNPIVIDKALEQIWNNDPALIEVNLNNIEDISQETLLRFTEALCKNTHVHLFSLANTHADDRVAFGISKMLCENCSIKNLNIESNFVSGQGILAVLGALQHNQTLVELRFHNQRHICGGKVEMEMVQLLRENNTLLKLGYQFDLPGPRMAVTSILTRNQDQQRQKRLQEKKEQSPLEINKQVTTPSVEKRVTKNTTTQHAKSVEKPSRNTPNQCQEPTTRKIAEMVKHQEASNNVKTQSNQRKPKAKKLKNGTNEKESVDIFNEFKNSLKPSVKRQDEPSHLPPLQKSSRDDLMAAIRGSSIMSLKRVDLSDT